MKLHIGDYIDDCYLHGIGELYNINNRGVIENYGKDWVIIRDLVLDEPVFVDLSIDELEKYID